jgi:hypothetical protein
MYINRSMSILATACLVLAFVLRAALPRTSHRWPIGSHYYRADMILFWAFLVAGLVIAGIVMLKLLLRGQPLQ